MHDCFISYSHKDQHIAVAIQNILEANGIRCWIDFRDAVVGEDYAGSIVRAIKASHFFILVLSQNSSNSTHVLNEINSGVNAGATIIPFRVDDIELNESMEYYLGRTHWMDALTPPLEKHINLLVERIKIYRGDGKDNATTGGADLQSGDKNSGMKKECRMLKYDDLLELGYDAAKISVQLVENDYINCNGIGMENEGTAIQWEEYLQDNSDTFQYLVNGANEIVGDWSIVALSDEAYEQAMNGELLEADIDLGITEMICFPGVYNGYNLSFSLLPEYRNMKNYNLLIESFLAQLEEYAENDIYFRRWCMNVFGKEVEAMIKQLGYKYVTDNKVFGKIFACEFLPLPNLPIYRKHTKLCERYSNVEQ